MLAGESFAVSLSYGLSLENRARHEGKRFGIGWLIFSIPVAFGAFWQVLSRFIHAGFGLPGEKATKRQTERSTFK